MLQVDGAWWAFYATAQLPYQNTLQKIDTDGSLEPPLILPTLALFAAALHAAPVPLFDGKTFDGWEGDTQKTWRIVDGAFVGGSLTEKVEHNQFLSTKKSFKKRAESCSLQRDTIKN